MDILARLKLAADEFSTETDRQFGAFKAKGAAAARDVNASFAASLGEVQKLTGKALAIPRTAGGSLDLSAEIAQLRAGAQAADQKAAAHFELRAAMQAAERAGNGNIAMLRAEAAAAAIAGANEEKLASQMRQRIVTLEAVQAELGKMVSATGGSIVVANQQAAASGNQRQSMIMLGQQFQDFTVQVASGQSAATAFAQQIGQAAFAIQGMGGRLAGLGAFLSSFGGIVTTVALVALAPWVGKLLEGNDALDKAVDKLRKDAEEARITGAAQRIFGNTVEGVNAAVREQNEALDKQVESHRDARRAALDAAEAQERHALRVRETTAALLAQAVVQMEASQRSISYDADQGAGVARARDVAAVNGLRTQLKIAEEAAQQARLGAGTARTLFAIEQGERAADPIKTINAQYDAQVQKLREVKAGTQEVADAIKRQVEQIERRRDAELKNARDRQSAANRAPVREFGREITSTQAASIARAAGLQVNSADRSTKRQKELYDDWIAAGRPADNPVARPGTSAHERGNGLDIQKQAGVTVQKIRDAFAAEGVRLTKVFAERGHWHVEWKRSAEQVRAEKDATKDQRELDASLESVTRRFDPARAAADEYAKSLAEIDRLETAKKISAGEAQQYRFTAIMGDAAAARAAQMAGWKKALGDAPDLFAGVADYDRGQASRVEKATDDVVERQRRKAEAALRDVSDLYYDLFDGRSDDIWRNFSRRALGVLADVAAQQTMGLVFGTGKAAANDNGATGDAAVAELRKLNISIPGLPKGFSDKLSKDILPAAGMGALGGGAFAAITGGKSSPIASAAGGVLGKVAGDALGKAVGSSLGALGKTLGPLGSIAGGILGNIVGGMLTKTQKASATIAFGAGGLSAGTATGSSDQLRRAAQGSANTVAGSVTRIADALGGRITGAGNVSIGQKNGRFVVDTMGLGRTSYGKANDGIIAFKTEEEAIRYAISDMLKDGVVGGISDASRRILQAGGDLEAAITKAALIEAVPRDLKAMLDPVGAATDDLNRKFQKTVDALREGGASAQQMAEAQRLYDLQLAQVKASTASASATLKEFMQSMNIGSSSPLSLRDQQASARAALDPYLASINAGQTIDQGKYQQAAQTYLDIQRQMYGSTEQFFVAFDAIQAATAKAISAIDNATPIGGSVESPFPKATAAAAEKTAANVQIGNEIADGQTDLLLRIAQSIEALNIGGGGGGSFVGADRFYRLAAN